MNDNAIEQAEAVVAGVAGGPRPLHVIAQEIRRKWRPVNYAAKPYLDAIREGQKRAEHHRRLLRLHQTTGEPMIITAMGRARMHFWGDFHATIGLQFHNADLAAKAKDAALPEFKIGDKHANVLVWHGKDPELENVLTKLASLGADRDKILSCKYSIDLGEPFTINVDLTPATTEVQTELFA